MCMWIVDLILSEDEIKSFALVEIDKLLCNLGRSLREFDNIPYPSSGFFESSHNKLILDELRYDRESLLKDHKQALSQFTDEQRNVYDTIMTAVESDCGGMFFVYGYGGTAKTFIWKSLSAAIRCNGEIVLNVASSGIASLLLPGGRTGHSRFKIPLNPNEDSICNIKQGSPLAELIVRTKLIVWDKAPMMHMYCFEALDRSLRDIMRVKSECNTELPFGGKIIVFGGDFRQILPVIPKGSRQDVVNATINSSYLWNDCKVLRLTRNMRLENLGDDIERSKLREFSDWIASIGDGVIGSSNGKNGSTVVDLPKDIVLKSYGDPIRTIASSIYTIDENNVVDISNLDDRAILAPTLDVVDSINQFMISLNSSDSRVYLSSDSICVSESSSNCLEEIHTPEFLNGLRCSGTPNHELVLKLGTPVMLLRNIDSANGLCNGTRLVLTHLGTHVLEGELIGGHNRGQKVLIPRLSLSPSDTRLPFKFQRCQFSLIVSYAMTIYKNQGQSLSHVGLFLKNPVFSHGQLYVAISRARSRKGLKVLVCSDSEEYSSETENVVYREVFQNL